VHAVSRARLLVPEAPLDCPLCPRLVAYREENAKAEPAWHNAPVPSFGKSDARLLIVGLAPGRGGANRTGRPFTGDWAGDLLYATLLKYGFAKGEYQERADDGLQLIDCIITNAVRCVPPENKPTPLEAATCRPFLVDRIASLPNLKAMVALGRIAHEAVIRTAGGQLAKFPFAHGAKHDLPNGVKLFDSFHCSRYNTNTRRLTPEMFEQVFETVKKSITR
jgi:uracil-DNA glycosylase